MSHHYYFLCSSLHDKTTCCFQRRIEYNAEDDIKRAEAAINRKPNEELLDHQRKRVIELKCVDFENLMENSVRFSFFFANFNL